MGGIRIRSGSSWRTRHILGRSHSPSELRRRSSRWLVTIFESDRMRITEMRKSARTINLSGCPIRSRLLCLRLSGMMPRRSWRGLDGTPRTHQEHTKEATEVPACWIGPMWMLWSEDDGSPKDSKEERQDLRVQPVHLLNVSEVRKQG